MPKHLPSLDSPASVNVSSFANNASGASPVVMKRIAEGINHAATFHKKQIFARSQAFPLESGVAGNVTIWRGFARTSKNVSGFRFYVGLADTDYASATNPYVRVVCSLFSDGSSIGEGIFYYNGDNPAASLHGTIGAAGHGYIDVTGFDPNVEFAWIVQLSGGARLMYMSAIETAPNHADDAVDSVVDAGAFVAEGPIYYQNQADVVDACHDLTKFGAAHLLAWCVDYDTAQSISATNYTNAIDLSSTTVSSSTPGQKIQTTYHNRSNASTVPVRFAVCAERTSGAGSLSVRLTDGTNSVEITGITTAGIEDWYVVSGTIPAGFAKYDIQAKVTSGTFALWAVSLFEYEA